MSEQPFNLDTVRATLDVCTWDLESEEGRMQTIDGKLTQLAAFSGLAISISAAVGGSVLAAGRLPFGFQVALGSTLGCAAVMLLSGVVLAFTALAPKLYHGVEERAVIQRTTPESLARDPAQAMATYAGSRRDVLVIARRINDQKARATSKVFLMVSVGFALL